MLFVVKPTKYRPPTEPRGVVYLIMDNWNDWFAFKTMYSLVYVDNNGVRNHVGSVKIGEYNMKENDVEIIRTSVPDSFEFLNEDFFSLGQDVTYYENLNQLGEDIRHEILKGLNDVAFNPDIFEKARDEEVMKISLLRDVSRASVYGQYRRLANGDASLSHYKFKYVTAKPSNRTANSIDLTFEVVPDSFPPTNVHILIGRNGVGKTYLLNNMIHSLIDEKVIPEVTGCFETDVKINREDLFANLVSVTFSAFDSSRPPLERKDASKGMKYFYVGLKKTQKELDISLPKNPEQLTEEFVESARACCRGAKSVRWMRAITMLEADPIFKAAEVAKLPLIMKESTFTETASSLFDKLSSGHKIILLTITRLVETVEERTLVLLDEPESHLHPPLLSAFTRALSDLLIRRNGVALIATHSPVVLQEVPKSCVWILRRSGTQMAADRPQMETFGESIGALTREVFGLEVTNSGFHKMLLDAVNENDDFESVVEQFNGELGVEAKAIIRALLANKH